ncbi:MAG: F0F1 ATP synthase subunit epsilon [Bacteroidales bacterium]|nr:F0F1 ATP synthase subunit epsilon [Bacteroidales bacterium]
MAMKLTILSPDKTLFVGEASLIEVPGTKGRFQMLVNHAPVVSTLQAGTIRLVTENEGEKFFEIQGGVIENHENTTVILAEV